MQRMAFGEIGFFTGAIEALAAAVGGGMLLGGFVAGSGGCMAGLPRPLIDRWVSSPAISEDSSG
jgi:hypothetical protein